MYNYITKESADYIAEELWDIAHNKMSYDEQIKCMITYLVSEGIITTDRDRKLGFIIDEF